MKGILMQKTIWQKRWEKALYNYWGSGLTLVKYCKEHNLDIRGAYRWRKRLDPKVPTKSIQKLDIVQVIQNTNPEFQNSGVRLQINGVQIDLAPNFNQGVLNSIFNLLEKKS